MSKKVTIKNILASVLHDLNPSRSVEEWAKHIDDTAHNPQKFFGNNGEGFEEYVRFTAVYDRDKYLKSRKAHFRVR